MMMHSNGQTNCLIQAVAPSVFMQHPVVGPC